LAWKNDMTDCKATVGEFLDGKDHLKCGCFQCESAASSS